MYVVEIELGAGPGVRKVWARRRTNDDHLLLAMCLFAATWFVSQERADVVAAEARLLGLEATVVQLSADREDEDDYSRTAKEDEQ